MEELELNTCLSKWFDTDTKKAMLDTTLKSVMFQIE